MEIVLVKLYPLALKSLAKLNKDPVSSVDDWEWALYTTFSLYLLFPSLDFEFPNLPLICQGWNLPAGFSFCNSIIIPSFSYFCNSRAISNQPNSISSPLKDDDDDFGKKDRNQGRTNRLDDVPVEEDKVDKDTSVAVETLDNCFGLDFVLFLPLLLWCC